MASAPTTTLDNKCSERQWLEVVHMHIPRICEDTRADSTRAGIASQRNISQKYAKAREQIPPVLALSLSASYFSQ